MTKVSLHRLAGLPQRFLVALGLSLGLLTIGAIAPPPSETEEQPPTPTSLQASYGALADTLQASQTFWVTAPAQIPDVLTVTLYTPDAACDGYQTEERTVVAAKAIPQIVHFLLAEQTPHLLNFELAGYRLQPSGPNGHRLVIDLRRSPTAQRQFISLSLCEQLVLFGSLRQTLLSNPVLQIHEVEFTERGRPIAI